MSESTRASSEANDPRPTAVVLAVGSDQPEADPSGGKGHAVGTTLARSLDVELDYVHVEPPAAADDHTPEEQIAVAIAAQVAPDSLLVIESEHADRWRSRHSVAEHLIDAHAGPAVVIGHRASGELPDGPVVVALDGSEAAETSLPTTVEISRAIGRSVELVRVVPEPLHTGDESGDDDVTAEAVSYLETVAARAAAQHQISVTSSVVSSNDPVSALVEVATKRNAGLLALASRGDRTTARASMSRTAAGLIAEAACPVLVVDTAHH